MAYDSIPDAWRDIGKAIKKDLVDRIHDNLEDLNNRVTSVEGSISTMIIANQSIKKERDHAPLGTIVWSPLSSAQFVSATDDGVWQLCDGSSVSGTDYGTLMSRTTAPDIRGKFLRMRAHSSGTTYNPRGDVDTDTVALASAVPHDHNMNHGHANTFAVSGTFGSSSHVHNIAHVHQWGYAATGQTFPFYSLTGIDDTQSSIDSTDDAVFPITTTGTSGAGVGYLTEVNSGGPFSYYTGAVLSAPNGLSGANAGSGAPSATSSPSLSGAVTSFSGNTGAGGVDIPDGDGLDTSPINVTENCFIKVSKNYVTVRNGYLLWRAPQALTINQVVLTPVTQGTAGTLTVDIKKGPLGSVTTSIFTATPTLAYTDAVAKTGTINATNAVIAAGEYVRVDITTTQTKLQEFHILIAAAP